MRAVLPLGLAAALIGAAAAAGQAPVRLTDPEEKVLVLRETRTFEAWEYAPPWELEVPASPDEASYERPESALAAWVGALLGEDEAWLGRTLTAERRRERAARPAEELAREGRFAALLFAGRRLVLSYRVEVEGGLLLELSSYDRESGERLLTVLHAVEKEEGSGWRVGVRSGSPVVDRLVADFDLAEDTLVVDEGFAVMTVKPN